MTPTVVVDVGNSRIKWGRCTGDAVKASVRLPAEPDAWQRQALEWKLDGSQVWAVAGVHPPHRDRFTEWARSRGDAVRLIERWQDLPLRVAVERPDQVGIDRLLNAVAANARREPDGAAVVVDAGSAITVDWVGADGVFRGGAIMPGLGLMAKALHEHTALLPLIEVTADDPPMPGSSTRAAMEAGIFAAAAGGIARLVRQLRASCSSSCLVFLCGGNADKLRIAFGANVILWPEMTLEGVRLAAEALP